MLTERCCSDKVPLNKALKKEENANANVPSEIKDTPQVQAQAQEKATVADTEAEADALTTPPDPEIPTGILSVIIHQINNRALFV